MIELIRDAHLFILRSFGVASKLLNTRFSNYIMLLFVVTNKLKKLTYSYIIINRWFCHMRAKAHGTEILFESS